MQAEMHEMFREWVCLRRGRALATDEQDLFTGEVWTGRRAVQLGLVDRLGTMRGEIAKRYPDAEILTVEGRRPLLSRLGLVPAALAMLEALEHRATWSRFGL
jgi:ClpP class serine protease